MHHTNLLLSPDFDALIQGESWAVGRVEYFESGHIDTHGYMSMSDFMLLQSRRGGRSAVRKSVGEAPSPTLL